MPNNGLAWNYHLAITEYPAKLVAFDSAATVLLQSTVRTSFSEIIVVNL